MRSIREKRNRPDDIYHYASLYLNHVAFGHELSLPELAKAEKAYVLWDWAGLAALAYEQFLLQGRGAIVGPRVLDDEQSLTVQPEQRTVLPEFSWGDIQEAGA